MIKKFIIGILCFSIPSACAVPSTMNELEDVVNIDVLEDEQTAIQIEVVEKEWKCEECTPEEQYVLAELQKETRITDRNALATILGNIKQESNFRANICEGGAKFLMSVAIAVVMVLFSGPH